jgi:hypothetical protein
MARPRTSKKRKKDRSRAARRPASGSESQTSGSQTPQALRLEGWRLLTSGQTRDALKVFRQLHKQGEPADLPLFCACSCRARQLRARGMDAEAAAVQRNASEARAGLDPQQLPVAEWVWFLHLAAPEDAVAAFTARAGQSPPDAAHRPGAHTSTARLGTPAEQEGAAVAAVASSHSGGPAAPSWLVADQVTADQLIVGRCWHLLEPLTTDHPLRRHSGTVREASTCMDAGDWAQASDLLSTIPRRSPFAPWRLFCKAMAAYGMSRDAEALRALDALPAHFVLNTTVAALRGELRSESHSEADSPASNSHVGPALPLPSIRASSVDKVTELLGSGAAPGDVEALFHALDRPQASALMAIVDRLSRQLMPTDPLVAREALLEIATLHGWTSYVPDKMYEVFLKGFSRPRCTALVARLAFMERAFAAGVFPAEEACDVIKALGAEHADPCRVKLATARSLLFLARFALDRGVTVSELEMYQQTLLAQHLVDSRSGGRLLLAGMAQAGLALDPTDRGGHDLWVALLERDAAAPAQLETALRETGARFPDDPAPWLHLARVHLRRNAYRKAQEAVTKARPLAPLDPHLRDLDAVIALYAAVQSRRRLAYDKAGIDLSAAAGLARQHVEELVRIEQLAQMLCNPAGGGEAAARALLADLTPVERVRAAAGLVRNLELTATTGRSAAPAAQKAAGRLLRAQKPVLAEARDRTADLCAPLCADAEIVYGDRRLMPALQPWWRNLLKQTPGEGLLRVCDQILEAGGTRPVHAELEARLKRATPADGVPVWRFYRLVLGLVLGKRGKGRELAKLRHELPPEQDATLREAARRLATFPGVRQILAPPLAAGDLDYLEALESAYFGADGAVLPGPYAMTPGEDPILTDWDYDLEIADGGDPDFMDVPPDDAAFSGNEGAAVGGAAARLAAGGRRDPPPNVVSNLEQTDMFPDMPRAAPPSPPRHEAPPVPPVSASIAASPESSIEGWLDDEMDAVARVEELIDIAGLRGMPLGLIREMTSDLDSNPQLMDEFRELRQLCAGRRQELSAEADTVLFKRSKRGGGQRQRRKKRR